MTAPSLIDTLVVDDEPLARQRLRSLVERDARLRLSGESEDGLGAIEFIRREQPKLVLLDVQMPELTGFEVLDALGDALPPAIVFVTAYDEFAIRAFDVGAADYLLKPYADDRFRLAIDRVAHAMSSAATRARHQGAARRTLAAYRSKAGFLSRVVVPKGESVMLIDARDIDWIESADNYVRLHVGGSVYRLRETMMRFVRKLDPNDFLRVHRWYAVNLARIRAVEPWSHGDQLVRLTTGASVRVSRTFAPRLRAVLHNDVDPPPPIE